MEFSLDVSIQKPYSSIPLYSSFSFSDTIKGFAIANLLTNLREQTINLI